MSWEIETVFNLSDDELFAEMLEVGLAQFLWQPVEHGHPSYTQYLKNLAGFVVPVGATSFSDVMFAGSVKPIPVFTDVKSRFFDYVWAAHEIEFAETDILQSLIHLLDNSLQLGRLGKRWTEVEIRSNHQKPTWNEVKEAWEEVQLVKQKKDQVKALYDTMSENIREQIILLFKTDDYHSAQAFAQSWKLKADKPEEYADSGLIAMENIAGFTFGQPLDTAEKIATYYSFKIQQLIAFDKFRDNEINTYFIAKTAIEA